MRCRLYVGIKVDMQHQEVSEPIRSVVIVAPIWLQNVLSLCLQAYGKAASVICAATFEALPFDAPCLRGEQAARTRSVGKLAPLVPGLVIFFAPREEAVAQVQKLKQMWPTTHLLVLADAAQAELQAAGADLMLPKEFSAEQFLNTIQQLRRCPEPVEGAGGQVRAVVA